jgi:hypothetical protein
MENEKKDTKNFPACDTSSLVIGSDGKPRIEAPTTEPATPPVFSSSADKVGP